MDDFEKEIIEQIKAWRVDWEESKQSTNRLRMDHAQTAIIQLLKQYIRYREVKG